MITLSLTQGTSEWLAHRRTTRNASEASIIMGCHPNCSRAELIRLKARGAEKEFSTWVRKNVLDKGHRVEAKARPMIEREFYPDDELFPSSGQSDDGKLCASFDGLPMMGRHSWECKQYNDQKYSDVLTGNIPECDKWQVVQQSYVNDKQPIYYTVTDGTDERTETIEYVPTEDEYHRLLLAWDQFEADLATYDASNDVATKPEGVTPDTLPALHVEATGKVLASNLSAYRDHAMAVLGSINHDLQTDQDFADAEQTVKWCKSVESKLSAAKDSVLGQMATVDEVCRTIDDLSAETRRVRLDLDKLVKSEKESRKAAIVADAVEQVAAHYRGINASLPPEHALDIPAAVRSDIGAAIKGKSSLSSITDVADTAAANAKIEASQRADGVRACIKVLGEFADHSHLFADRVQLCASKSPEDLRNLAKTRVTEYEGQERRRLEAERQHIRAQEEARAAAKVASEREAQAKAQPDVPQMQKVDRVPPATDTYGLVTCTSPEPVADDRLIKLGDINAAIAPLSITADGLRVLCDIEPADVTGRAKMYRVADVQMALDEMHHLLTQSLECIHAKAKEVA